MTPRAPGGTAVGPGLSGILLRGAFARHRLQSLLCASAIALGVALGYAIQLINGAAISELAHGAQVISGDADLVVSGPRTGFDENVYPALARQAEVAVASPVVEVDVRLAARDDTLRLAGIDVFAAGQLQPGLVPRSGERFAALRSDTVFLSPAAARWLGLEAGGTIEVQVGLSVVALRVGGVLDGGGQQRFAVMDIAGAQQVFDRLGRLSRIDLRLRTGVDGDALRTRLQAGLPAGVVVERPAASQRAAADLTRAYRVNLLVLALVALFTGSLLVFSTQALSVVRRRAEFALLRVLGLTRRQLLSVLVAEGAAVGVIGSIAGLAAGHVLALLAVRLVGADLGAGFFRGVVPDLAFEPSTAMMFVALGVAAAVGGALLPALEAARAAPAQALKAGDDERVFERLNTRWPGLLTVGIGVLVAWLPPVDGLPLFGYLAIALVLVGTLLLLPWFAGLLLWLLPLPRRAAGELALTQLRGAPGRATVSLAAIVASISLIVSMAIMVASFRSSVEGWLEQLLPADAYLRAGATGDTALLSAADQRRIAALPGVRRAEFQREDLLQLAPGKPRVALLARTIDPARATQSLPFVAPPIDVPADAPPPVWVSEAMVDLHGFAPGTVVELPLAGETRRFTVAGVWRDYSRPRGTVVIERSRYIAMSGDDSATNAALWLDADTPIAALSASLASALPGGERLELGSPNDIRRVSLSIFDRTFTVTYALELAAMVIGLVGLSSSFAALVVARRREFGVLRHLGMTRGEVRSMLAIEGALVSTVGIVIGLLLGGVISLILIHVVNRQSFHWGMALSIPWALLAAMSAIVLGLSTLTATVAGRQALAGDAVRAVREDW
jgi:putative ABC transport system permease protein